MNSTGWGRRRLLGILVAAVVAALVLAAGLGFALIQVLAPAGNEEQVADTPAVMRGGDLAPSSATGQERRNEIAAAPMLAVSKGAMKPAERAPQPAPVVSIPSGTGLGPAYVLTGFPHTPEGAAGQLAQLEVTVLQAMSLTTTQHAYDAWAMPGGPGFEGWGLARAVDAFLDGTGMVETKDPAISVRVQPVAALIKGTDGTDWVTVCVLTRISATFRDHAEVAYGHCERMQWHKGRWMIAPGSSPAPAPSTWPGTPLANDAGWRTWVSQIPTAGDPANTRTGAGSRGAEEHTNSGAAVASPPLVRAGLAPSGPNDADSWAVAAGADEIRAVVGTSADGGAGGVSPARALGIDLIPDVPNPLGELGKIIARAAADGWTAAMLAVWDAGLLTLRMTLVIGDRLLTPDLSVDGPGQVMYEYAFWIAGAHAGVMLLVQLGVAAFKREGKSLARAMIGGAQFVVVCGAWVGYCAAVLIACSGLSDALMGALLGVTTWKGWDPTGGFEADDITDAAVATVLGLLGVFVFLAAITHLLIMLGRAAALMVLAATGPIAAAGLGSDAGQSWFWKSLRWFHAAALTPVLMVLVLGVGVQFSTGTATGMADSSMQAIGTALPGLLLVCVSCVTPMALFKLLAFVDPGTPSGASFRQGMAANGGLQGLLAGKGGGDPGGSAAASQADEHGRSPGEAGAEGSTTDRFAKSAQAGLSTFGGGAGSALAAGIGMVQKAGAAGAALMSDVSNQAGVGHHTHGPDFSSLSDNSSRSGSGNGSSRPAPGHNFGGDAGEGESSGPPTAPAPPAPPVVAAGATSLGGTRAAAGGGGAAGAGGGALLLGVRVSHRSRSDRLHDPAARRISI